MQLFLFREVTVSEEEQKHLLPVTAQAVLGLWSRRCCCVLHPTVACAHQRSAAGRRKGRGGLQNFGMFVVDLFRAVTNNICLV